MYPNRKERKCRLGIGYANGNKDSDLKTTGIFIVYERDYEKYVAFTIWSHELVIGWIEADKFWSVI